MSATSFASDVSPYANANATTASPTVGLTVSAGGSEVAVNNLAVPVMLEIPLTLTAESWLSVNASEQVETCLFWKATDAQGGGYWDGEGCIASTVTMVDDPTRPGKQLPSKLVCACFHLTDFSGVSEESIPSPSLPDPADAASAFQDLSLEQIIVLVFLGAIFCCWFAACIWGYARDKHDLASFLADPVAFVNHLDNNKLLMAFKDAQIGSSQESTPMRTAALFIMKEHVIITMLFVRPYSTLSRPALVTVFMIYSMSTLVANAMFFGNAPGGTSFVASLIIGIMCSLIVVPTTFLFGFMFQNVRRRDPDHQKAVKAAMKIVNPNIEAEEAAQLSAIKDAAKLKAKRAQAEREARQARELANVPAEESAVEKTVAKGRRMKHLIRDILNKRVMGKDHNGVLSGPTLSKSYGPNALPAAFQLYVFFFSGAYIAFCTFMCMMFAVTFPVKVAQAWLIGVIISLLQEILITNPLVIMLTGVAYYYIVIKPKTRKVQREKTLAQEVDWEFDGKIAPETNKHNTAAEAVCRGSFVPKRALLPPVANASSAVVAASLMGATDDMTLVSSHLGHMSPSQNVDIDLTSTAKPPLAAFVPHPDAAVRYFAVVPDDDSRSSGYLGTQMTIIEKNAGVYSAKEPPTTPFGNQKTLTRSDSTELFKGPCKAPSSVASSSVDVGSLRIANKALKRPKRELTVEECIALSSAALEQMNPQPQQSSESPTGSVPLETTSLTPRVSIKDTETAPIATASPKSAMEISPGMISPGFPESASLRAGPSGGASESHNLSNRITSCLNAPAEAPSRRVLPIAATAAMTAPATSASIPRVNARDVAAVQFDDELMSGVISNITSKVLQKHRSDQL